MIIISKRKKEIQFERVIFSSNIERNIEPECFLCVSHYRNQSGHLPIKSKSYNGFHYLHRWIYWKVTGKKPKVLRHRCDHPDCINIAHLQPGNHLDNVNDRVERNRSAVGERNGRSKLTESKVRKIKKLIQLGYSNTSIARKFNVSRKAIYCIRKNKTWKHVKVVKCSK